MKTNCLHMYIVTVVVTVLNTVSSVVSYIHKREKIP